VLAANYMSGSAVAYARNADGTLGTCTSFHQYKDGTMVNPARQEGPHAHMCMFDTSENFVYVPDLGGDVVRGYTFNHETGAMLPSAGLELVLPPGSGPRHIAFHPTQAIAYVLNELLSTVSTCTCDAASGKLTLLTTTSALPDGAEGSETTCAAIRVLSDGSALYASNRGHDSIARFTLGADGMPVFAECTPAGGKTPRDFVVLSTEGGAQTILLVGCQDSDIVSSFAIGDGGALAPTGSSVVVKSPSVLCQV
jgi:6-phosphogluconolactonase